LKELRRSCCLLQLLAVVSIAVIAVSCRQGSDQAPNEQNGRQGGRLVATFRSGPRTFNRFVAPNIAEGLISRLTQGRLVRFNPVTHVIEPSLARAWSSTPDGLIWTLKLREGVKFSDGEPFSSADVLFTIQVLFDKKVDSDLAGALAIDGKPWTATAPDPQTVVVTFPAPYGPGILLFDGLPILPRHRLESAYLSGTFRDAWGLNTPLADIAGLGPFVVREYTRGRHVIFARNPHYGRTDEQGRPLPYLDEIELQIVSDQNGEVLRLEGGESDLMTDQLRAEDIAAFRALVTQGKAQLAEPGVSINPDGLWFNLVAGAVAAKDRPWLQRDELRLAISLAVDRQSVVDSVYYGAAVPIFGPITPGHGDWYLPDLPKPDVDLSRARQLLSSIGLTDRNGDGMVEDTRGRPARFSILVPKGSTTRERVTAMIQQQLVPVGLTVDIVALDSPTMIDKWGKADYDAMYFSVLSDSFDPSRSSEFWLSSGGFHFWNPKQPKPSTTWEGTIDALMRQVSSSVDPAVRRRAFAEVQKTMAAHMPVLYFAAPKITIPMSARLRGATASVLAAPVLWNAERLSLVPGTPPR